MVFILTKLPVDVRFPSIEYMLFTYEFQIHLSIQYTQAFPPGSAPLALSNLAYERANILYNLAALYCQLATSEDRSNGDGIKRSMAYFQVSPTLPLPILANIQVPVILTNSKWVAHRRMPLE